jgi:hypothetical protein
MPELGPIIASLRAEEGAGLVRRRVDPSSPLDVYLCTDLEGTQLGVILAVQHLLVPLQKDLPTGAGFAVRPQVVKDDAKGVVSLGVFCTDTACEDIFLHFMEDLVSHLLAETGQEQAVRTFMARLGLWQRFFVAGSIAYLSEESQSGLFAELLLLRDLIIPSAGASAAVDGWHGPDGKPQDFVLTGCALEVKCSRAKAGGRIAISNEQQLDERPFPHLVLSYVSVTLGGGANPSLADIVAEIRLLLGAAGRPLDIFNDKLITAGWIDAYAGHYSENRFFVREVRFFDIRDEFPRIRAGDFPPGVIEISYKLDLAALSTFALERAAIEGWLKS